MTVRHSAKLQYEDLIGNLVDGPDIADNLIVDNLRAVLLCHGRLGSLHLIGVDLGKT